MDPFSKTSPLVSLITPGWNGKSFVYRLLDSILAQTYSNLEYIYVDDGSTDGSIEIVESYRKKFEQRGIPFNLIKKENGGVSSAVMTGLQEVRGKYLCWPEYDDWLTPDSVERKVNFLETHPDCAVVTSDAWLVNDKDIEHPNGVLSGHNPNRYDRNHFVQALLSNSVFTAACQMCRMDIFDETHPGRKIYSSPIGPNWQILLPLYYKYNRGWIEQPLCYYYVRPNSISNGNYQTFEKRAHAINEFIKAIKSTLLSIDMPEEDKKIYIDLVDHKYALDRLQLGYEAMNKEIFNEGIAYFKDTGKPLPSHFQKISSIFDSKTGFEALLLARKLKHILHI